MQLKSLGANKTEITYDDGTVVLYSYATPVAACLGDGGGFVRTSKKWSVTTSKHINQWLGGVRAREVSQDDLVALVTP